MSEPSDQKEFSLPIIWILLLIGVVVFLSYWYSWWWLGAPRSHCILESRSHPSWFAESWIGGKRSKYVRGETPCWGSAWRNGFVFFVDGTL